MTSIAPTASQRALFRLLAGVRQRVETERGEREAAGIVQIAPKGGR